MVKVKYYVTAQQCLQRPEWYRDYVSFKTNRFCFIATFIAGHMILEAGQTLELTDLIIGLFCRSAPEVILDGHYTYASDVWAFGILAWELYQSFTTEHDIKRDLSVPFYDLENREVNSRTGLNALRSFFLFFFVKKSELIFNSYFLAPQWNRFRS